MKHKNVILQDSSPGGNGFEEMEIQGDGVDQEAQETFLAKHHSLVSKTESSLEERIESRLSGYEGDDMVTFTESKRDTEESAKVNKQLRRV